MTNQELNLKIAQLVYPDAWYQDGCMVNGVVVIQLPDYCNNWNNLMPLVIEHGIDISNHIDGDGNKCIEAEWWYNQDIDCISVYSHDTTPQRALAECLLLVLQEKEKANAS